MLRIFARLRGLGEGKEAQKHLEQASEALLGLVESYKRSIANHDELQPAEKYDAFCAVLDRDIQFAGRHQPGACSAFDQLSVNRQPERFKSFSDSADRSISDR